MDTQFRAGCPQMSLRTQSRGVPEQSVVYQRHREKKKRDRQRGFLRLYATFFFIDYFSFLHCRNKTSLVAIIVSTTVLNKEQLGKQGWINGGSARGKNKTTNPRLQRHLNNILLHAQSRTGAQFHPVFIRNVSVTQRKKNEGWYKSGFR